MARVVEGRGAYEEERGKGEGSWDLPSNPEYAAVYCYSRTPCGTRTTNNKGDAASAKMLVNWLSVASKSERESTLE